MVEKVEVPVHALREGMYVCELDRPWLDSPFLFQGFLLNSEEDIAKVKEVCEFVYVDPEKSVGNLQTRGWPGPSTLVEGKDIRRVRPANLRNRVCGWLGKRISASKEHRAIAAQTLHAVEVTRRPFDEAVEMIRDTISDLRLSDRLDMSKAEHAVSTYIDHIASNPDTMLLLSTIKDKDEYTSHHSVDVSILALVLGHRIGMPRSELQTLGLCGLLHDIGKVRTPDEILKKPGRLTPDEYRIIKEHTVHGRNILLGNKDCPPMAVEVAHNHHERLDGSGYPRGLREGDIGAFIRIVAIADTYDAMTTTRVYKKGRSNIECFKVLLSEGNHYDPSLISELIAAIGIFSPGSVGQLSNGQIGVVVRNNEKHMRHPVMLILRDAKLKPIKPRFVDLLTQAPEIQVDRMLSAEDYGIDTSVLRNPEFLESIAR